MPSFKIEARVAKRLGEIERLLGRWEGAAEHAAPGPREQQANLLRSAVDTAGLSGNGCSFQQATLLLRGRPMLTSAREVLELENALIAYQRLGSWDPLRQADLLEAHAQLMEGLAGDAGQLRRAAGVNEAMRSLFRFASREKDVPAILTAVYFHSELIRIRPFSDGNGRVARLWQRALLARVSPFFAHAPVESLLRERQARPGLEKGGAPVIEQMLEVLFLALKRAEGTLHGRAETPEDRLAKARQALSKAWFPRKAYLSLFPRLSTASASRDLALGVSGGRLSSRGERALTEYRFR